MGVSTRTPIAMLFGLALFGLGACASSEADRADESAPAPLAASTPADQVGVGGGGRPAQPPRTPSPAAACVRDALAWLAAHQDPQSGHWSAAGFDAQCGRLAEGSRCDGAGSPQHDVGVTSLALLAFLGAGETPKEGEYAETVAAGLDYLLAVQAPDGNFGTAGNERSTYDHLLATLAMTEAYALSKAPKYKAPAIKGLEHMYALRKPGGAWRYAPSGTTVDPGRVSDTSVTAWAVLCMTLAREYGLPLEEQALADAMAFLDEMTDPETGITGYDRRGGRPFRDDGTMAEHWPGEQSEATTAAAVLCRLFADQNRVPGQLELIDKGVAVVAALPPRWDDDRPGRRDFHHWYFGTYALYQRGGPHWETWAPVAQATIPEHQRRDGDLKGSWDPQVDPWGGTGGRVYATAMLALTMEVFGRY